MKTYKFTEKPEFPFDSTIFEELQADVKMIESVLGVLVGTGHYIVSGCEVSAGNISAGYIFSDGVLSRFEGGTYYDPGKIYFSLNVSAVSVAGINYTRWTERVARLGSYASGILSPGEVSFSSFKRIGNLILQNHYLSRTFSSEIFAGSAGISGQYGRVVYSPHFVDIKVRFSVNVFAMEAAAANVINITGWTGGLYDVFTNKAGWVGTYKLTHNHMGAIKEMHAGNVALHATDAHTLQLYLPYTRALTYDSSYATPATFSDLSLQHSSSSHLYVVEVDARLMRNDLRM